MTTRPALIGPVSALRQALILLQEQSWRFVTLVVLNSLAVGVALAIVWLARANGLVNMQAISASIVTNIWLPVMVVASFSCAVFVGILFSIAMMQLLLPQWADQPLWSLVRSSSAILPSLLFLEILVTVYMAAVLLPAGLLGALLAYLTGQNAFLGVAMFCGCLAVVWLLVRYVFCGWVLLAEGITGRANLRRGMALVRGRWWAVLWRCAVLFLLLVVPDIVMQVLLKVLFKAPMAAKIFGFLMQRLTDVLWLAYSKVLFDDLRRVQGAAVPAMEPLPAPAMA